MELITELNTILGPSKPLKIDPEKCSVMKKPATYPSLEEIYIFLTKAVQYRMPVTTKEWHQLEEQIAYLRTFQKLEVLKLENKTGLRQIKKCVTSRTLTTMDMIHKECKHATKDRRYHMRWKKWMAMICIYESLFHPLNKQYLSEDAMQVDKNIQTSYIINDTTPTQLIQSFGQDDIHTVLKPTYNDIYENLPYTPLPYMLDKREIKSDSHHSFPPTEQISCTLFGSSQEILLIENVENSYEWTTEEDDALLDIMESIQYSRGIARQSCWPAIAHMHNLYFHRPSDFMGKERTSNEIQKRYMILTEQRPITSSMKLNERVDKLFSLIALHQQKKPKPIQPTKKQPHVVDKLDLPVQTPQEIASTRFTEEDQDMANGGSNQFYQYLNRPLTQQQVQKRTSSQTSTYNSTAGSASNQPMQNRTAVEQWQSFLAQRQYLQSYAQPRRPEEEYDKKKRKRKSSTVTLKQQDQQSHIDEKSPPQPAQQQQPMQAQQQQMQQQLPQGVNAQQMMQMQAQMAAANQNNQMGQMQPGMVPQQYGYSNITNMQWMAHLQRQRYRQFTARPNVNGGLDIQHQAAIYSYNQRPMQQQYFGQMGQYANAMPQQQMQQPAPVPVQKPQKKRKKSKKDD